MPGNIFICTHIICIHIQKTDLAGHAENVERYSNRLQVVDRALGKFIEAIQAKDRLVAIADHGNDPTIGHSRHTREQVPLLLYQHNLSPISLSWRTALSDAGTSACYFFNVPMPQNGRSFLPLLSPTPGKLL